MIKRKEGLIGKRLTNVLSDCAKSLISRVRSGAFEEVVGVVDNGSNFNDDLEK